MRKVVESAMAGQPDKICDQIAEGIVDEYLRRDAHAHVDVKVLGSHGMVMIGGEVSSSADFDVSALAQGIYREIGYTDDLEVFVNVDRPSPEMSAMTRGSAGDTAVVNGYATRETRERLPAPVVYAHTIARRIDDLRRVDPLFAWLRPDGKVQVVMERDRIVGLTILVSHDANIAPRDVQTALLERVVTPLVGEAGAQIYVNPLGNFTTFGFHADSGASGRRMASDTYGGLIPHGDATCIGKDPLAADRAGALMARFAARQLVDQGLASSVLVTAAYTLGRSEPIHLQALGTGDKSRGAKMDLTNLLKTQFDFRPEAIVERLHLRQPIYRAASVYGMFGRLGLPWEENVVS